MGTKDKYRYFTFIAFPIWQKTTVTYSDVKTGIATNDQWCQSDRCKSSSNYCTSSNFQEINILRGALKHDFCIYLFTALINGTVHELYNIHGWTNIIDYILTKRALYATFAKISSRENIAYDMVQICSKECNYELLQFVYTQYVDIL